MLNTKPSSADALGFSVKEVEREFESKLEQLDILGAKRDLLVGQLLCEYRPRFIKIVEATDLYNGKLETYYRKRFDQDPSNVQRYMRVWEFWSEFALKDGSMTLDDLAKYPNSTLDAVRRLYDTRKDAVMVIGREVHLNPMIVTDGRGTHIKDFKRTEIELIGQNMWRQQEQKVTSLADKGIEPDDDDHRVATGASTVQSTANNGLSGTEAAQDTRKDPSGAYVPALPAQRAFMVAGTRQSYVPTGVERPDSTVAQAAQSVPSVDVDLVGLSASEPDDSTASSLAVAPLYPRTFRGKDWPVSQGTVPFSEGDVTTDNSGPKFIYRAVNCRVQVVVAQADATPQIVIRPVDEKANGSATVWLSGQYDDTGPVLIAYTYDAQLGLGKPTRFVKMEG